MKNTRLVQRAVDSDIAAQFPAETPAIVRRVLASRGIKQNDSAVLQLRSLLAPYSSTEMKGLREAVERIVLAIEQQQSIVIIGDFDADGATSTALMVDLLKCCAHQRVSFLVPDRFIYGYGLTPEIVELSAQSRPDLIVTVDNGISSVAGVDRANALNIDVIVTDHHLPGNDLPKATSIVNPNQPGCQFPSKALAGVGVIFYVANALVRALDQREWFSSNRIDKPNVADYLDLVALGTVADVVPLDANNSILVEQGLRRIRAGKARPGIKALIDVAQKSIQRVTASDIGFALGPRLNAAGRLDDMSIGIGCLLSQDYDLALGLATELDTLNRTRREIEADMKVSAERLMQAFSNKASLKENDLPTGVALHQADWHEGVVGILASRVKDMYQRPVICFAESTGDPTTLKGSARSVDGFHIRDCLDMIASHYPELINKFGGHAMAAGLSIDANKFQQFADVFDQVVGETIPSSALQASLETDGTLVDSEITLQTANILRYLRPWGQKMPEPLFEGEFLIDSQRIVGSNHLKLVLRSAEDSRYVYDAIAFSVSLDEWPDEENERVKIAYSLDENYFRGDVTLQLLIKYIEKIK